MKARRLKVIANWINTHRALLGLVAVVRATTFNTDQPIPGTRLRHRGRGRKGNEIIVRREDDHDPWSRPLLQHNAAETYRSNDEVERWLTRYIDELPPKKRHAARRLAWAPPKDDDG